jgi:hypothetical protein
LHLFFHVYWRLICYDYVLAMISCAHLSSVLNFVTMYFIFHLVYGWYIYVNNFLP